MDLITYFSHSIFRAKSREAESNGIESCKIRCGTVNICSLPNLSGKK